MDWNIPDWVNTIQLFIGTSYFQNKRLNLIYAEQSLDFLMNLRCHLGL